MYKENIDVILYYPFFFLVYNNNKKLGRLCFYTILSGLFLYEFIDKEMYYFHYNDLNEYNYVGNKCRILAIQYFLTDIFFLNNKSILFHHILMLIAMTWSYILNNGYCLAIYLSLNEISSMFLGLKNLNIFPKYSNICFMISFFVFRILLLPILTYIYSYNNFIFTALLIDNCLHYYWVINLYKKNANKLLN